MGFEHFRLASGMSGLRLSKEDEESHGQVNAVISSMRDEANDILQSFSLTEANRNKYEQVKTKF